MARVPLTVVLLTFLAIGAACGSGRENSLSDAPTQGVTTQPTNGTTRSTVYFLIDDGAAPIGVRRTIETKSPYVREALKALLVGPTPDEEKQGVTTAIPDGTRLLALTYKRHGTDEIVNLAGLPPQNANVIQKHRIITQIARTMIGVSGIERIWLQANGRPWGLTLTDGSVYSGPWSYEQLTGWHIGVGCPGTEAIGCDHFDALP